MIIRVALADDHPRVRSVLRLLLSLNKDIEFVCEAKNGQEAVECVKQFKPDVLVMDISMPVIDGFEATQRVIELEVSTQVILISFDIEDVTVKKATEIGARGFLPKDVVATQLFPAIQAVCRGETFFIEKS
jgi:DNA-binding NarL/FixJ family response regulator